MNKSVIVIDSKGQLLSFNAAIGSTLPCPICNIPAANQHSLRASARCDAIRRFGMDQLRPHLQDRQRRSR